MLLLAQVIVFANEMKACANNWVHAGGIAVEAMVDNLPVHTYLPWQHPTVWMGAMGYGVRMLERKRDRCGSTAQADGMQKGCRHWAKPAFFTITRMELL